MATKQAQKKQTARKEQRVPTFMLRADRRCDLMMMVVIANLDGWPKDRKAEIDKAMRAFELYEEEHR